MSLGGREQNYSFIQLGTSDSFATNYPPKQNEDLLSKMLNIISLGNKLTYHEFGGRNGLVVCGCLGLFCLFTGGEQQYPLKFSIRQSSDEFFFFPLTTRYTGSEKQISSYKYFHNLLKQHIKIPCVNSAK